MYSFGRHGAFAGQTSRERVHHGRHSLTDLTAPVLENALLEQPRGPLIAESPPEPRERQVFTKREREGAAFIRSLPTSGKGSLNFFASLF